MQQTLKWKKIIQISNYFRVEGEGETEDIVTNIVSDKLLFKRLAHSTVDFSYADNTKNEAIFLKYFKIVFVIFGVNGMGELWFKTSLLSHIEPIGTLSLIAGMLLSLWIFLFPMYWWVAKINAKKHIANLYQT